MFTTPGNYPCHVCAPCPWVLLLPAQAYVQDLIRAQGGALWKLLQQGARVFVCGDARAMAPDVRRAFVAVAQQWGGLEQQEAEAWLAQLLQAGRFLEDVWAS